MNAERIIIADNQALTALAEETIILGLPQYKNNKPEILFATTSHELGALLRDNKPTAVIIDYTLFDFDNSEKIVIMSDANENASFLIVSEELTSDFLKYILCSSERIGIVYKDATIDNIREALSSVIKGKRYIDKHAAEVFIGKVSNEHRHNDDLTPTEREVLKSIAMGKTTKEIALERFSSFHTINTHRKNIFRKLGVNCIHDATKYALKAGLVEQSEFYI